MENKELWYRHPNVTFKREVVQKPFSWDRFFDHYYQLHGNDYPDMTEGLEVRGELDVRQTKVK